MFAMERRRHVPSPRVAFAEHDARTADMRNHSRVDEVVQTESSVMGVTRRSISNRIAVSSPRSFGKSSRVTRR